MVDVAVPNHVLSARRDGKREILLHRSVAVLSPNKVEIKAARSTVILPIIGIALAAGAIIWMIMSAGSGPLWLMVGLLFLCLFIVPASVMGLVSTIAGADVVVDGSKRSATWQQGYLGMGIGTKELVPFEKIAHLEVTVEGEAPDRWKGERDSLRQFALVLVKVSGKRLTIAQVPVPAFGQEDGMDRTLALGHAIAAIAGTTVHIPEGWELVEVDTKTLEPVPAPQPARNPNRRRRNRR